MKKTDIVATLRAHHCSAGCNPSVCLCSLADDAADEIERLRTFIQTIADAPDAMVCRLTRDAAKETLANMADTSRTTAEELAAVDALFGKARPIERTPEDDAYLDWHVAYVDKHGHQP